jgi:hypothetical protein
MPLVAWLSRICEEFGCVPSEAYREWVDTPTGMVEDILGYRAYAKAKAAYDQKAQMSPEQRSRIMAEPLVQEVREIEFALMQEAMEARAHA